MTAPQHREFLALLERWQQPLTDKLIYPRQAGPVSLWPLAAKPWPRRAGIAAIGLAAAVCSEYRPWLRSVFADDQWVLASNGYVLVAMPRPAEIEPGFYTAKGRRLTGENQPERYGNYQKFVPERKPKKTDRVVRDIPLQPLIDRAFTARNARRYCQQEWNAAGIKWPLLLSAGGGLQPVAINPGLLLLALNALVAASGHERGTVILPKTARPDQPDQPIAITTANGCFARAAPLYGITSDDTHVPINLLGLAASGDPLGAAP